MSPFPQAAMPSLLPSPHQRRFVSDLALGDEISDVYILSAAQQAQARNGPYWRLDFKDAGGVISGKIWSPQSQAYPDISPGLAVHLRGKVTSYRDRLEVTVDDIRVLGEEERATLDLALFMPASPQKPDDMLAELLALARKTLTHKPWRKLVTGILTDAEIAPLLCAAPAAKGMHHAYAGGLLEHTLSVARLCMRLADHYPELDRQALLAGAICHDLGKIWELSPGLTIDYTTPGRLIGHITLLVQKLAPLIKKSGLEAELAEHLEHLVLSHHGTFDFGSPRLPSTAEAIALHYADNIDAKLQQLKTALDGVTEGGWSPYNTGLERFLYRAPHSPEPPDKARAATDDAASGQPLPLFDQCSLLSKE